MDKETQFLLLGIAAIYLFTMMPGTAQAAPARAQASTDFDPNRAIEKGIETAGKTLLEWAKYVREDEAKREEEAGSTDAARRDALEDDYDKLESGSY